jgi:hypothetical protein
MPPPLPQSHGPYRGHDLRIFWDFLLFDKFPVLVFNMSIHFLDHSFGKLFCIWLLKCLMVVHDITHHLGMKHNGILHAPL